MIADHISLGDLRDSLANLWRRPAQKTHDLLDRLVVIERMTGRDRVALETYRDARAALALIREAVEDCAPPGSVTREGYLSPEFTIEAEALVRGIYPIADRCRTKTRR